MKVKHILVNKTKYTAKEASILHDILSEIVETHDNGINLRMPNYGTSSWDEKRQFAKEYLNLMDKNEIYKH